MSAITNNNRRLNRTQHRARANRVCRIVMLALAVAACFHANIAAFAQSSGTLWDVRLSSASEPNQLSLAQAVEIALRRNPLAVGSRLGRGLANSHMAEAKGSRLPILQLTQTTIRSNNPIFVFGSLLEQSRFKPLNFDPQFLNNPSSFTNVRSAMTFRMPLFDQKQSATRIVQAEIGQQDADSQVQLIEQSLRFQVLQAYFGVLVAQAQLEVAEEAVKSGLAEVKRIGDLVEAGTVVRSDLLSAQVQLAEFHQQSIQARGDLVVAQASLNAALGTAPGSDSKLTGTLVNKTFAVGTQAELIRAALDRRQELTRATLALKSSKEKSRAARGEYLPRVDAYANYGWSSFDLTNGSADYSVGISLTFNLFDAARGARLDQARMSELIAAANAERIASQIRLDVVRAYQLFTTAQERVVVAEKAEEQAGETLRIIRDRYEEGLTTITEVLRAETAFVRAQTMLLGARYDHYVGYAAVLFATGSLIDVDDFNG
jgi:outer membrane protein